LNLAAPRGGTRRYSDADITRLRRISELIADGINLTGVGRVLGLEADNADLRTRNATLKTTNAALQAGTTQHLDSGPHPRADINAPDKPQPSSGVSRN
jgi:DNA-binding transcriptional MerR regulator